MVPSIGIVHAKFEVGLIEKSILGLSKFTFYKPCVVTYCMQPRFDSSRNSSSLMVACWVDGSGMVWDNNAHARVQHAKAEGVRTKKEKTTLENYGGYGMIRWHLHQDAYLHFAHRFSYCVWVHYKVRMSSTLPPKLQLGIVTTKDVTKVLGPTTRLFQYKRMSSSNLTKRLPN